jgi:hypothetical protein
VTVAEPTKAIDAILTSTKSKDAKDFAYAYVREHREEFVDAENQGATAWAVGLLIDGFEAGRKGEGGV